MLGNSAVVQLCVHFVTSPSLGEGMKEMLGVLPVHDSEEIF